MNKSKTDSFILKKNEFIMAQEPKLQKATYDVAILREILHDLQERDIERLKDLIDMKKSEVEQGTQGRHNIDPLVNIYLADGFKICLKKLRTKLNAMLYGLTQHAFLLDENEAGNDKIRGHLLTAIGKVGHIKELLAASAVEHSPDSVLKLSTALLAIDALRHEVNQVVIEDVK